MKRYLILFFLLMKRMVKKPAFILLLLSMLIAAALISRMEQEGNAGVMIGLVMEEEPLQEMVPMLGEQNSILQFQVYERKEKMLQDIKKGELDCGVVLPAKLLDKLSDGTWRESIVIYRTSSTSMTEIVKERIASILFTLYSERSYADYVESAEAFDEAEASGIAREEIVLFAQEAYRTHLLDGSTFSFQYHDSIGNDYYGHMDSRQQVASSTFRLRGVLAACIFLSGMCGLLTDWEDRQEKRFLRIAPRWLITAVNIWVPTIYTSVITLMSLYLAGDISGHLAGVGKELCHLLFYQFLIVAYCSIIRLILRKQETIAAAIPILTLAGIICCPVWIRLAVYLPVFGVLEKLFPVTYYLNL